MPCAGRPVSGARVRGVGARQDALDITVRARDDVHRDQFPDTPRGCRAGIGGGLDGADIAAHENRDIAGADLLLTDQHNMGRFGHGIRGLNGSHKPLGLDHAESFH